jgi:hypothetical protein
VETQNGASKTTCEIDDKNRIEEQLISSQTFYRTTGGRVQKITTKKQFKSRILESFGPATQEIYRHLPATIHKQLGKVKSTENRTSSSDQRYESHETETAEVSGWRT